MRIDTLVFLNVLLTHHPPSTLHPHIEAVIPVGAYHTIGQSVYYLYVLSHPPPQAVIQAVNDSFYKITSEGLLVLQHIVTVIRPLGKH